MCPLSNTAGSIGNSPSSGEAGDIADAFTGKDYYQDLIDRANTVPLIKIFRQYGVRADSNNRKIVCPFKHHKNGRESTPSFWYYPNTNTFCCYGCNTGGKVAHGCEFIAAMENISKVKAAHKILDLFSSDVDVENIHEIVNFSERLEIMLGFSNFVREFRQTHLDEKSREFIEDICEIYDRHNLKRDLGNDALRSMINQLKETVCQHML